MDLAVPLVLDRRDSSSSATSCSTASTSASACRCPSSARTTSTAAQLINTIGPVWDLNETWVIVAGACPVRRVPRVVRDAVQRVLPRAAADPARAHRSAASRSSTATSGRVPKWKQWFDRMIVVGSAVPALLWGVAFANIVQGVPLDADHNYTGSLLDLLNPYALLGGLTTLLLFFTHGVVFVSLKTEGELRERARRLAARAGFVTIVVAAVFLVWTGLALRHASGSGSSPPSRPWRSSPAGSRTRAAPRAWRSRFCAVTIAAAVFALFASLFPDVMPASNDPANSLTIANASSTDVHADGHELGGARLPAARAGLPGLDVLGVPQACDAGIDRGGSALT